MHSMAATAHAMPRAFCHHGLPSGDSRFVFIALGWRSFVVFELRPDDCQQPGRQEDRGQKLFFLNLVACH